MTKKKLLLIILIAAFGGWVFSIFPGKFLEAKISTVPFLNKFGILNPQAPIVINKKETVRVSDNGDAVVAIKDAAPRLSLVASVQAGEITVLGGALNLTADGAFITTSQVFGTKTAGELYVILNDGSSYKINDKTVDPATGLVFFLTEARSVQPAFLASSKELQTAEKIIFASGTLTPFNAQSAISAVTSSQSQIYNKIFLSDKPSRSFTAEAASRPLMPGEAVLNTKGEIVGIYSNDSIISSDVIKQAQALFLKNKKNIIRPKLGFSYEVVFKTESQISGQAQGALVKTVEPGSPAQDAGLNPGDVIVALNGQDIVRDSNLEEQLEDVSPLDAITLTVMRKAQKLELDMKVGTLK